MQIRLAYGRSGLDVSVPDDATVLLPRALPSLGDEARALSTALEQPIGCPPLSYLVPEDARVVIVFSDITRPMPNDRVLPVLLAALEHVPSERITLLNGLGTHRPNTPQELEEMLGRATVERYHIAQHNAWDKANLVTIGINSLGRPVRINRTYQEADVKILTGFIEPHIFAGFSGGPKAVLPAVAGIDTIMDNHGYSMLNHPSATWGVTEGNPVWEEMREAAAMTAPDFLLNVALNCERAITGVFAGDVWQAHGRGVEFVRSTAMRPVDHLFDIAITTNSGYPLDINLYQAVKGMSAAAGIVKPGGSIIIAAECREGIPDYGEYKDIIHEGGSLQGVLDLISQPGYHRHDQWEAQLQVGIQSKADVYVYSDYLSDEQLEGMLFKPCSNIEATLTELLQRYGPEASICVLPEGPQTVPYLSSAQNHEEAE